MKKKNGLKAMVLLLLVSLSMSSCYYGYYGPPRPKGPYPRHHHGGYGGYHGGGYGGYRGGGGYGGYGGGYR